MRRPPRHEEAERLLQRLSEEEREKLVQAFAKILIEDEIEQAKLSKMRSYS